MNLQELKRKTPAELLAFAEELEIENASSLRKQDMLFAILKQLAENDVPISGDGVLEVLSDGFGFLRSPEANYLAGPDDIYVSPSQVRRFGLRTGDTVEGEIRSPRDGERYFALLKVSGINFDEPDRLRQRINFDNLTPPIIQRPQGAGRPCHEADNSACRGEWRRGAGSQCAPNASTAAGPSDRWQPRPVAGRQPAARRGAADGRGAAHLRGL
jgi:hypothetical protein